MNRYEVKLRGYERSVLIRNEVGTTVAEVFTDREPGDQYRVAPLMAIAPDLLAVLKQVEPLLAALDSEDCDYAGSVRSALLSARAVINKAEGEQL